MVFWLNVRACLLLFLAFFYQSCEKQMPANNNDEKLVTPHEAHFVLDGGNRVVTQTLDGKAGPPEKYKFVEVSVAKVMNPKEGDVSFEVHYEPPAGDRTFLGTFSLYPPNNPGRFLVPTTQQLRSGGKLVLSLVLPDGSGGKDVRIEVNKMRLVDE